jgi:triosephosphate isomerase
LLPDFINLATAVDHLEFVGIDVAAQNMHQSESGAFTGEYLLIYATKRWCEYCNSWTFRTQSHFNETDALIASKVNTALEHDMTVIFVLVKN